MSGSLPTLPADAYLSPTELRQLHAVLTFRLDTLLDRHRRGLVDGMEEVVLMPHTGGLDWAKLVGARRRCDLDGVLTALKRVQAGVYGTCGACREAIGYRRLFAVPTATCCTACAVVPHVSNGFAAA